jgi:hypothetical protein
MATSVTPSVPTTIHQVVKAEKLAAAAVGMLEQELIIPRLFAREGLDNFKGADDDTVSFKVEGVLPYHDYEWRSGEAGSSTPGQRAGIVFDEYKERKIAVTFGGNVYSAVKLTDEQNDFDIDSWSVLLRPQVKAVARGIARRCVKVLQDQEYAVTIGNAEGNLRGALIEARRVLNQFRAPGTSRFMLLGSNFESALLGEDKLTLAQNVGDAAAESALRQATLGQMLGFTFVVDPTIDPDTAYAFADTAFALQTAAPSVPQSAPYGATQSFEGLALRWVRDYDSEHMQDRSVVNTYVGTRSVSDILVGWDETNRTEIITACEHFDRGIKLTLDGSSDYPAAASELARITGVSDARAFTPTGAKAETDPANA